MKHVFCSFLNELHLGFFLGISESKIILRIRIELCLVTQRPDHAYLKNGTSGFCSSGSISILALQTRVLGPLVRWRV